MEMAAGVIAAKARSMLGEQLDVSDYEELLRKRSVAEIAAYLKNQTAYGHALKDVRENNIHRGQLEDLLRKESFHKSLKLFRYSESTHQEYYQLHMQQIEQDLLLKRIRVLISQAFEDAIAEFPIFLKAYTSYDLTKLGNVRTYDELLEVVKHTPYERVLLPFRVKKGKENDLDYTGIETALQQSYYTGAMDTIDRVLKGKSRKQCRELFAVRAELGNLVKIYRYKKFFQAREDTIRRSLVPIYYRISKAKLEELLSLSSLSQFLTRLKEGPYHLDLYEQEDLYIEYYTERYLYTLAKRNVYFAQDAPTVYSSYQAIMQRELDNIINIIEGVRYQVNSEDIAQMLVY